ncbi:MAG: aldo/keto reductase, partial [Pyramidobacter sp.]|nr:aldo/keto reductase [Pyramidobacter sp.]
MMRLPNDQDEVNQLVDYAIEHGVNYFDTAPM